MLDPLIGQGAGPVGAPSGTGVPRPGGDAGLPAEGIGSFKSLLENSIQRVNEMQQASEKAQIDLVTGGAENAAEAFAAVKKAEIAFQQLVEIRNKLVDAYQEVMRMQI